MAAHFRQWLWASYWSIHTSCPSSLSSGILVVMYEPSTETNKQKPSQKGNHNKHSLCNEFLAVASQSQTLPTSSIPSAPTSYFIPQRQQNTVAIKILINEMIFSKIQRLLNYFKRFQLLSIICDFIMGATKK